jgi:hypothetical protein
MGTFSFAVHSRLAVSSSICEAVRLTKNALRAEVALSLASRFKPPNEIVRIVGKTEIPTWANEAAETAINMTEKSNERITTRARIVFPSVCSSFAQYSA